jgi:hypothetical protein
MGKPSEEVCPCCCNYIESVKEVFRMPAANYMDQYLDCPVLLDNHQMATARIDKYLNHGIKPRADEAWAAKDQLLGAVVAETKTSWKHLQFVIDSWVVTSKSIVHVFTGKGSPSEVKDALWLAHRYGFITNPNRKRPGSRTLKEYTDAFCGLDCNGFVGNFEGIDPNTPISSYGAPSQRLSSVDAIDAGTTLVWHAPSWDKPWAHIAVIDAVIARGDPLTFTVVQSGGPIQGVHSEVWTKKAKEVMTDKNGHLYLSGFGGAAKVYLCKPLSRSSSN